MVLVANKVKAWSAWAWQFQWYIANTWNIDHSVPRESDQKIDAYK